MITELFIHNIDELSSHKEIGFDLESLKTRQIQEIKDTFYCRFRDQMKIPTGELLSDSQLSLFLSATYQLILKFLHPELNFKVLYIPDSSTFKVVYSHGTLT